MDDDCPGCGTYHPKMGITCGNARCDWLYKNLTPEQLAAMNQHVRDVRKRNEEAEVARQKLRQEEADKANYARLKQKFG